MSLLLHLSIHILLSIFAGWIIWLFFKKYTAKEVTRYKLRVASYALLGGIIGGFLIDFDHFFDYFLAFGLNFKPDCFLHGYQFLKSDKIYILFHGWEYAIILLIVGWLLKQNLKLKSFLLAVSLGLFFHLAFDIFVDQVPPKLYFITNRIQKNFNLEYLVYFEHWKNHLEKKYILENL